MRRKTNKLMGLKRSLLVATLIVGLAGSVTFAALQSQSKLTGNTIATATAGLTASTDGTNYAATLPGFNFTGLVPGGASVPSSGYGIWLRNSGNATLGLKLAVSGTPTNPNNADLSKVKLILMLAGASSSQTFTLQSLIDANATGGVALTSPANLAVNSTAQFTVRAAMDADAINGSSASLGNIDLVFSGIAE